MTNKHPWCVSECSLFVFAILHSLSGRFCNACDCVTLKSQTTQQIKCLFFFLYLLFSFISIHPSFRHVVLPYVFWLCVARVSTASLYAVCDSRVHLRQHFHLAAAREDEQFYGQTTVTKTIARKTAMIWYGAPRSIRSQTRYNIDVILNEQQQQRPHIPLST